MAAFLSNPSLTSEAFAAARRDLARYKPSGSLLPALRFMPTRRSPVRHESPARREFRPRGPLLRASAEIRTGSVSCAGLLELALQAARRHGQATGAIISLLEETAKRQAEQLDAELAGGRWRGPLHGIPITVKDNIDVAGAPTRAGSAAHNQVPVSDAEAVQRLRDAGAIIVAKVATHEFALGVTTPQARHPQDPARIPGGSSGGSAISVATGMALGSIGTDTRASIRVPASLCGVTGLKPTFGAIPTGGIVWLSWTMDHVGVLAGSAGDAACVVSCASSVLSNLLEEAQADVSGWRVGVAEAGFIGASGEVDRVVRGTLDRLLASGVELVPTTVPGDDDFQLANAAGLIISRAEALSYHRSLGTDLALLWPETADQLRMAQDITAAEYLDAQRFRQDLADRMSALMVEQNLDALCMPTTLVTAPLVSEAEQFFTLLSRNAIPWSLVGWPSISVPCLVEAGCLPVGTQLVAPPYEDASLVSLGAALENAP